ISTGEAINTLFVVYTGKYIDRSATSEYTSQQNWHVVRLADVYLMRAEALAELAQNPAIANENINALRMRAGVASLYDGAGKTMDDFRTDILRERATELHMEGHRFFDLTRMGVYNEYCITVHNATRGVRGPEDYTWPIPIIESSANASID
ncbi:MAG: RagB/SusD family nutrient uptake outer membrane protein, partial [Bacteroidota bacterium]